MKDIAVHEARILGGGAVALAITLSLLALPHGRNDARATLDVTLGEFRGTR